MANGGYKLTPITTALMGKIPGRNKKEAIDFQWKRRKKKKRRERRK